MSQSDRSKWPRLTITSSISPSKISLSEPTKERVILSLTLRLLNSMQPITFLTSESFLNDDFKILHNFYLVDLETKKCMPALGMTICLMGRPDYSIAGPDNLITLHPGVPKTFDVDLGVSSWTETTYESEQPRLCATKLSYLEAGRKYKIAISGGFEWQEYGDMESLMWARIPTWKRLLGARRFKVEDYSGIRVEIVWIDEPVIEVVD